MSRSRMKVVNRDFLAFEQERDYVMSVVLNEPSEHAIPITLVALRTGRIRDISAMIH